MARTKGSRHVISSDTSRYQEARNVIEAKAYVCTKKEEEMHQVLAARGIKIPNFTYDFSIPEGSHCLSDTNNEDTNIVLSSEDEGRPEEELRRKKRRDHSETYVSVVPIIVAVSITPYLLISPVNSPPPPKPINDDAFGVIVAHGPFGGSIKFHTASGEIGTLFPWREKLSVKKFPFSPDEVMKQWNNLLPK
ncbi:hypothetical protein PVK06_034576 [Gossypium arboreum]|uniref:Uncharacterized protein n=1 Tax=Gossypium arboreum TaxID=29729 RepID=A0ABR0NEI2_GOSAR|nr:hypothetical protein PVK06_034576 [Gossypium arboreum]